MGKSSNIQYRTICFAYVWHGFFLAMTLSMLDLNTVFPALVTELTDSKILFGFLYAIMLGAPLVFNLVFSHYLKSQKYKKKFLLLGIYMRSAAFLGMAISTWFFGRNNPKIAVYSFFIWVFLFSISAGFAGIAYADVIGKTLPRQRRAKLYAVKQFFASMAAFAGGIIINGLFKPGNLSFPGNYTLSLMIGFAGLAIASLGFFRVQEPASPMLENQQQSLISYIRNVPDILKKDQQFRRFILLENLASFGIMMMPFYMIYASDTFQSSQTYLGRYLMIQVAGTVLSSFIWGLVSSRKEARVIVRFCMYLEAVIPVAAIFLARTNPMLYGMVFLLMGFAISGRRIGFEPYLLDIAPEDRRTEYLGIRGTLNVFTVILPIAGGFFISQFGYKLIFIIVSAVLVLSGYLAKKQAYANIEKKETSQHENT
ncbi:MAG: MFS transporter [Ruminococcaceae bacterium]|jgi:MFS family permease|nr:MFS transporter [Oscillospiraceae bacterium]